MFEKFNIQANDIRIEKLASFIRIAKNDHTMDSNWQEFIVILIALRTLGNVFVSSRDSTENRLKIK